MRDRQISELASVDFSTGSRGEAIKTYGDEGYALGRRWAFELALAAGDSQAAMASLKGHPLLFGLDVRLRARQVAKRVQRMAELADGLAYECRLLHADYVRHVVNSSLRERRW